MMTLILGVGHPDRGDDAAGPMVARALEPLPHITARVVHADPSDLLTDPLWDTAERVVLVDTVRTGQHPGTVHRWSGRDLLAHLPDTGGGTHDLGVATTLHLAAALERFPADLTVIGIEGVSFVVGQGPCRPVRHAVGMVAATLARESGGAGGADALQLARDAVELTGEDARERARVRVGQC